jgi:hypothetical protein
VRDAHLSFHSRELGGSFHFIRCVAQRSGGFIGRVSAGCCSLAGLHL